MYMEGSILQSEVKASNRRLKQRGTMNVKMVGDSDLSCDAGGIARAFAQLSPGGNPGATLKKGPPERSPALSAAGFALPSPRQSVLREPVSVVQQLYELCKMTFDGHTVPSASGIERVRQLINTMKPSDVGLDNFGLNEDLRGYVQPSNGKKGRRFPTGPKFSPPITYLHVYECPFFSIGVFCLPTSAVIPLHNHPGMTVLSKLLHGSMHVRSFDWLNPSDETANASRAQPRLAKLVMDEVMTAPCESTALFPTSGGNIHAFTAHNPCAILDVLAPPYCKKSGRDCTYYHEVSSNGGHSSRRNGRRSRGVADVSSKDLGWLEPFEPEGMLLLNGVYTGPALIAS